jgi:hypothetical protein
VRGLTGEETSPVAGFDRWRTDRLEMRRWQDGDREPFAALNAGSPLRPSVTYRLARDPGVMTAG